VIRIRLVILIVLDSVGCGGAPDATAYGDEGADTLSNIARVVGGLDLPNLGRLGLGNLTTILGVPPNKNADGANGRLTEVSAGKDTTTGHWELCGIVLDHPFPVYPGGFPGDLIHEFESRIGRKTIGNFPASGTEIIKDLGEEHCITGKPIIYTSADSVFQVAAHEDIIPVDELYRICRIARDLLQGEHAVGRVIARPFVGSIGNFLRTERRRDFSLDPPKETILDVIKTAGQDVIGVGKIEDIFNNRGLTKSNHTGNNMAGIDAIIELINSPSTGLIFANLVDFDALYGHRNDPKGYANALITFDGRLPDIVNTMHEDDVLILTADHGNDPTFPGTDHTRERVPILIYGNIIRKSTDISTRSTFADVAASIADFLSLSWNGPGTSFVNDVIT